MDKEQELREVLTSLLAFTKFELDIDMATRKPWSTLIAKAEAALSSSSDEQRAEVVGWQVTQYDPNGRLNDASTSLVRGALPSYYRTERWGSSGHIMWEVIPLVRASPSPAVATDGVTEETVSYVMQYGGNCRDCADENGTCPHNGLPCDVKGARKAIGFVLRAVDYGTRRGHLAAMQWTDADPTTPDSPGLDAGWLSIDDGGALPACPGFGTPEEMQPTIWQPLPTPILKGEGE